MKIVRTAVVKHVMTEAKKAQIILEFQGEMDRCRRELEQLEFQLHKATKDMTNRHEQQKIRQKYRQEIRQREERLETISFKVQQLHKLELGSEIRDGTTDIVLDLNIGDRWYDQENQLEIIIKDGRVHEIRESGNQND